jgi:hypothetical protein
MVITENKINPGRTEVREAKKTIVKKSCPDQELFAWMFNKDTK